jgi:hypothetical protein
MNPSVSGTLLARKYHEGPAGESGEVTIPGRAYHKRFFTYETPDGLVAGMATSVIFTIDRPVKDVWPYVKDFNLWQAEYGHKYSGVIGDLYSREDLTIGDQTFHLSDEPTDRESEGEADYVVLMSVPEYVMVCYQPVPDDGSTGGVSPGFHVFMLNEHRGRTIVTVLMEHAERTQGKTEDDALEPFLQAGEESRHKWLNVFIPTLEKLVYGSTS